MKKFFREFKAFITKGNIVDLAVAVILGGAFNKIVSSLVNDVIMPLISLAVGGADVSDWKIVIRPADVANGIAESAFRYGAFLQAVIDFLIIGFTLFLIVKIFMVSKKHMEQAKQALKKDFSQLSRKEKKVLKKQGIDLNTLKNNPSNEEKEEIKENIKTVENAQPENTPATQSPASAQSQDKNEILLTEIRDLLKASLVKNNDVIKDKK